MREVELLAPAGDLEKLKIAFIYGADAVYIGGEVFGMRSAAKNFSKEDMIEGVDTSPYIVHTLSISDFMVKFQPYA